MVSTSLYEVLYKVLYKVYKVLYTVLYKVLYTVLYKALYKVLYKGLYKGYKVCEVLYKGSSADKSQRSTLPDDIPVAANPRYF